MKKAPTSPTSYTAWGHKIRTLMGNTTTCTRVVTHTRNARLRDHGCWVTDVRAAPKEACAWTSIAVSTTA